MLGMARFIWNSISSSVSLCCGSRAAHIGCLDDTLSPRVRQAVMTAAKRNRGNAQVLPQAIAAKGDAGMRGCGLFLHLALILNAQG